MAKTITLKDKDNNAYTLEFTRKTVKTMERQGFKIDEIDSKPMTVIPALFAGAFIAHHKFVKSEVIEDIFYDTQNRDELISMLADMYNDTILSLIEGDEGNSTWEVNS